MGTSTTTDIAKNIARIDAPAFLCDLEDGLEEGTDLGNGWTVGKYADNVGQKSRLYADTASDGTHTVMLINESEYSMVGEYEWAVFADKVEDVAAFLAAFGLSHIPIADVDTIQHTG